MSYNLSNDAEQPEPAKLPAISAGNLRRLRIWSLAIALLVALILVLWWAKSAYTDWLWFGQLGYQDVFLKVLTYKVWPFIVGTLVAAGALSVNLFLAYRFSFGESILSQPEDVKRLLWALVAGSACLTVAIAAPILGGAASESWETFMVFFNRVSFGVLDPQFSLDASFYIATLSLFHFVQGWFLGLAITAIVASLALYAAVYSVRGLGFVLTPRMLGHVAGMGAWLMLIIAAGHALQVYGLVLSDNGVVFGATYTDVHARVPALWLLTAISMLSAAGFAVSRFYGGLRLIVGSFSLWVIAFILAGLVYPALFQRFQVVPDQLTKELPYIQRNLDATRAGFQLNDVQTVPYAASGKLDAALVEENRATVDNIRLWDVQPLRDAYNQLQFIELYYRFQNMDSDRYVIDGRLRQVLVAARELDPENLPADAQNWVNQTLQYTHGYGVAMSPATEFTPNEGRPGYFLQDIPIEGKLAVSRPELYYGESPVKFVIVGHSLTEVDPNPEFKNYDGDGGVPLSSRLRRFAYAWHMGDINVLLSDQITRESRIQYRRTIKERVKTIAPFLKLDADPYPVVDDDGRMWWIQDAYTTTRRYPYSTPHDPDLASLAGTAQARAARRDGGYNYIRNSVKVVVDAYNGGVAFYVIDSEDSLLQIYRKAFPSLFMDIKEMPPDLRRHIRYPIGMFSAQAQTYLRYHVTDPQIFFNQADQWAVPLESRFGKRGVRVTPSYLVLKNPGEDQEEFVLMLPFTPAGDKKNLVSWLVARNDSPNYGQLLSFRVPSNPQVDGPSQVEARIENDQEISQQFTLWEGAGSQIIRGQLLVIPIAGRIIYVESLYLQSEVLAFPELKKVILADGSDVVMANSVDEGLAMLIGGPDTASPTIGGGSAGSPGASSGVGDAGLELPGFDEIEAAVTGLGDAVQELEEALEILRESVGGRSP
ncbi:MAG: hypothetical protein BZY80_03335 [SAR202 cluster bacterium Io17-Chloro-G2]|nr:MAG: hypothetical protein BZY80_03335 [SAR202 cluster bacterium Io17-Chloro-G2]